MLRRRTKRWLRGSGAWATERWGQNQQLSNDNSAVTVVVPRPARSWSLAESFHGCLKHSNVSLACKDPSTHCALSCRGDGNRTLAGTGCLLIRIDRILGMIRNKSGILIGLMYKLIYAEDATIEERPHGGRRDTSNAEIL